MISINIVIVVCLNSTKMTNSIAHEINHSFTYSFMIAFILDHIILKLVWQRQQRRWRHFCCCCFYSVLIITILQPFKAKKYQINDSSSQTQFNCYYFIGSTYIILVAHTNKNISVMMTTILIKRIRSAENAVQF